MAISIMTNLPSMAAQRNLNKTQHRLNGNLGRLSSGLRINQSSDDAAGLAISEKLKSQIRSMGQAERNAQDGVSMLQTAEGALNEISSMLTRMRELAIQSGNGTLGSSERSFLKDEMSELSNEIDRIADVTEFNGAMLIDGSFSGTTNAVEFQVGIEAASSNQLTLSIGRSALGLAL